MVHKDEALETIDMPGVEILRPGTFHAKDGRIVTITDGDVRHATDNYDPAYFSAPCNLDHEDKGPAQGWVKKVRYEGGRMIADLVKVPLTLYKQIEAGAYRHRSAELKNDPEKGIYLRGVAWLGARPPAVKGLADPAPFCLADADGDTVTILLEEGKPMPFDLKAWLAGLKRKPGEVLKVTAVEKDGDVMLEMAEDTPPDNGGGDPKLLEHDATIARLTAEAVERDKVIESLKLDVDTKEVNAAVATMLSEGRLMPAEVKAGLPAVLLRLKRGGETIKLADGSESTEYEQLLASLKARPAIKALTSELSEPGEGDNADLSEADLAVAKQLGTVDLITDKGGGK